MTKSRPQPKHSTGRIWLGAIIALHLVLGLVYWSHTAYGVAPDERFHGLYTRHLVEDHQLPVFSPSDKDNYETHQPPLYYALGVPFYLAAEAAGAEDPGVGARALSLILGALSILVVYAAIKSLIPDREHTALACAGFVAFLPMHLALSSSVANDILMELVFGTALLLMTKLLSEPGARVSSPASGKAGEDTRAPGMGALLGMVLGLGLLTKTTCVLLYPAAVLVYVLLWRRGTLTAGSAAKQLAAVMAVGIAIGGWWLVRNTMLYGDPFALSQFNQAFTHTARPEIFVVGRSMGWSGYFMLVGAWTFASFWGVFGHMKVFLPSWIYLALSGVSLVALVGSIRPFTALRRESAAHRDALIVYAAVGALVLLSFIRFNLTYFQAQGRYLYPAIIPIALAMVLGIERLLPEGNRKWSAAVVNGGMLLLSLAALVTAVIPNLPYQQP